MKALLAALASVLIVGGGKVGRSVSLPLGVLRIGEPNRKAEARVRATLREALDDEARHLVVGFVARRNLGAGRLDAGRIAHQPVGAQRQRRRQDDRKVDRQPVQQIAQEGPGRLHAAGPRASRSRRA